MNKTLFSLSESNLIDLYRYIFLNRFSSVDKHNFISESLKSLYYSKPYISLLKIIYYISYLFIILFLMKSVTFIVFNIKLNVYTVLACFPYFIIFILVYFKIKRYELINRTADDKLIYHSVRMIKYLCDRFNINNNKNLLATIDYLNSYITSEISIREEKENNKISLVHGIFSGLAVSLLVSFLFYTMQISSENDESLLSHDNFQSLFVNIFLILMIIISTWYLIGVIFNENDFSMRIDQNTSNKGLNTLQLIKMRRLCDFISINQFRIKTLLIQSTDRCFIDENGASNNRYHGFGLCTIVLLVISFISYIFAVIINDSNSVYLIISSNISFNCIQLISISRLLNNWRVGSSLFL